MIAIEVEGLTKSFGPHQVLHGIDFQIQSGTVAGFLGPNGAGKSTTIRILMGLIHATSGQARVFGQPVQAKGIAIRRKIGYLPGDVHLYRNLTGKTLIRDVELSRGVSCFENAIRLAEMLSLDLCVRIGRYSSGMKQKLGIILSLMHEPELLILDEPTSALDPLVRKTVFDLLREFAGRGKTLLFSSHTLNEVEQLCDEVIILRAGRIVEHQTIDELKQKSVRRVTLEFNRNAKTLQSFKQAGGLNQENFHPMKVSATVVRGSWSGNAQDLLTFLQKANPDGFSVEPPDLEDLFLAYYSSDLPKTGRSEMDSESQSDICPGSEV